MQIQETLNRAKALTWFLSQWIIKNNDLIFTASS